MQLSRAASCLSTGRQPREVTPQLGLLPGDSEKGGLSALVACLTRSQIRRRWTPWTALRSAEELLWQALQQEFSIAGSASLTRKGAPFQSIPPYELTLSLALLPALQEWLSDQQGLQIFNAQPEHSM